MIILLIVIEKKRGRIVCMEEEEEDEEGDGVKGAAFNRSLLGSLPGRLHLK